MRGRFPDIGSICVFLDSSRGSHYGDDGEDVHHRRACDRLRHRGERGVWFGAGAAGLRGIDFGGGPDGPPPPGLRVSAIMCQREPPR